jgi:hypothetical protein
MTDLIYKFYEVILLLVTIVCMLVIGMAHLVLNILYGVSIFLTVVASGMLRLLLKVLDN